ncbi:MAG: hypothetical protein GQ583_00755 [Methyloprofundus sp.]|nr:hypothetical protein [Methyloprofundus sp.]
MNKKTGKIKIKMKKNIVLLSLSLALLGHTYSVHADTVCYDVEGGEASTNNISAYQQSGKIELSLTNQETGELVSLEGDLNGMIIGADAEGTLYLTHTATSNDGSVPFTFITLNDRAVFTGAPDGCFLPVHETITNIIAGTGITVDVVSVNLDVYGSINFINEGECLGVPNTFENISGEMCFNQ